MSRRAARARALVAAAGIGLGGLGGCAMTIDSIYLFGDRTKTRTTEGRMPTTETREAREYAARVVPGGLALTCTHTTRTLDRVWTESRTYQLRGGLGKVEYGAGAGMSGVFGAVTLGVTLGTCLQDDPKYGCGWAWLAAPLIADVAYGVIRAAMVESPKLIARDRSRDDIGLGAIVASTATACAELREAGIGGVTGAPPSAALDRADAEPQRLSPDARRVALTGTASGTTTGTTIALTQADVDAWGPTSHLYVVDADGVAHAVVVDRCAAMRPFAGGLPASTRAQFDRDCPLPAGTTLAAPTPAPAAPAAPALAPAPADPYAPR